MNDHQLRTPADYRRMPWKNGGGQTWEIAVDPPDAGLSAFTWRVSIAAIERDGPFSPFPGVDRTIVLLSGDGMRLSGDGDPVELRTHYEPVSFAGESALECSLEGGPSRDFNLMVRRANASGEVVIVRGESRPIAPASAYICYAAAEGSECLLAGLPPIRVAPEHAFVVRGEAAANGLLVCPTSATSVALVAIIAAGGRQ